LQIYHKIVKIINEYYIKHLFFYIKYKEKREDVFFIYILNGHTMFRKIEILYLKKYDTAPKNSLHRNIII